MNPDRLSVSIPFIEWKYGPYIAEFIGRFILFVIMDYVWGEYNIKKQRKFIRSLEDTCSDDL